MSGDCAITARGLVKHYGETVALGGIDLDVPQGSVCGVLGPNGAGKTTAVRILTTLAKATEGTAKVAGFDVATNPTDVRRRIGLAAQDATVDGLLTGYENLVMIGELHHLGRVGAKLRADELLEQFTLVDARDRLAKEYSGGMRRRLDLAATLVAAPEVLFLDEPTTGLDPRARKDLWDVLDRLVAGGSTVLLTTQYLDEAERLADEIVVIDHGKVIARGDSRSLKREIGGDQLEVVTAERDTLPAVAAMISRITGCQPSVDEANRRITAHTSSGVDAVAELATALSAEQIAVEDLGLHQPSLDDVFLTLTGQPVEADERETEAVR
jgi:ABC-2 type transport system ATP-binding protein